MTYGITFRYHLSVNTQHKKTLQKLFSIPESSDITWEAVESLFIAVGAKISEGSGSRVRVALKDLRAVFHRPHPNPKLHKGIVRAVRKFLISANITPHEL